MFVGSPTSTSANGATYAGIMAQPYFSTSAGQTGVNAYGMWMYPNLNPNAGTIANYFGIYSDAFASGAGTVTNAYGGYFLNPRVTTTNTKVGLFAESILCSASGTGVSLATGTCKVDNLTVGSITGLLKASAGVVSQAVAGTDYYSPSGVIPIANGGTGYSSYLAGQIMAFSGSTTVSMINPVATGSVLISQGTSSVPVFSNQLTLSNNGNKLQVSGTDTSDNSSPHISFNGSLQAAVAAPPTYFNISPTIKTNGGAPASQGYIEYINGTFGATGGICYYTNAAQLYVDQGARLTAAGSVGGNAATNAFGIYAKLPAAGTGDNRVAVYADNLYVGQAADNTNTVGVMKVSGAATLGSTLTVTGVTTLNNTLNTQNVSTTGTVTATSTVTGSNLNLSGFTFNGSLACAATTYSSTWSGMTGGTPTCNFTLTRFGYIVTLRISPFTYPSTQTNVPYCGLNPSGWAPKANTVIPIIANHGNAYVQCCLLVNTNCTFYIYGPQYSNSLSLTNAGQSFPNDCVVTWSMY
jgi:hypothetical protein